MVMKRLFIFLALFVAVGSIQAVEVVLTDVSDQEIARIEHDVLKSEMINSNLVDEGDTEVRVPVPNQTFALVTKVVELANSQYKLPVNLGRPQLIELIKIADHLNIRPLLNTAFGQLLTNKEAANWWGTGELNSLGSLLDTTFSTIFRMENDKPDYSLINRFVSPLPIGEELTDVAWVDIAPDSSYYWVRFRDGRVQMYGRDGVLIGEELTYVRNVFIAPDSSYYWVHFMDDNGAQMYGRDGALIGEGLTDVWNVFIAPDSSYFWVKYRVGRVQLYSRKYNQTVEQSLFLRSIFNGKKHYNISKDSSLYERIFAKLPQTVRNELRDADQVTITNEETG